MPLQIVRNDITTMKVDAIVNICGVQVEEIEDPLMRDVRYLDKLVDELAKGKAMEKILRKQMPDDE